MLARKRDELRMTTVADRAPAAEPEGPADHVGRRVLSGLALSVLSVVPVVPAMREYGGQADSRNGGRGHPGVVPPGGLDLLDDPGDRGPRRHDGGGADRPGRRLHRSRWR